MKIAFNARVLATEELRGWSRYMVNLLDGVLRSGHEVFLFSDRPINQKLIPHNGGFCQVTIRQGRNYIDWEQRVLAQLCHEHKIDVLHCPINYGLPLICRAKKVLTLHDAIEKVFYDKTKKPSDFLDFKHWKMRGIHYLSQKAADKIITVSEHAKQDIIKEYGVPAKKIEVIYEGPDPDFDTKTTVPFSELRAQFPSLRQPYFFYVGGLEERKNIDFLLAAWAEAKAKGFQLVIGGGTAAEVEKYRAQASALSIEVIFTGYIPQPLLPSFFAQAHCFIYPSLYEGFGLQIVEAMQMGTPVICSNVTSLPEILGDPSCTFDPRDKNSLAALIQKMTESTFRKEKISAIMFRRQAFSWTRAVQKTLLVYESLTEI